MQKARLSLRASGGAIGSIGSGGELLALARALQARGRLDEALVQLGLARTAHPHSTEIVTAMAEVLVQLRRENEAMQLLEGALARQPRDAVLLANLGLAHVALRHWETAIGYFERAAALRPGDAAVLNNLGNALREAGRARDALRTFSLAAQAQPGLGMVQTNMARTLLALGHVDQALNCFAAYLATDPRNAVAWSDLLLAMNYSDRVAPEQLTTAHRRFAEQVEQPLRGEWRTHRNTRDTGRKLRVAYVSSDLRNHAVAHFVETVLVHRDASRVEAFAYFNGAALDEVSARLQPLFTRWQSVFYLSDAELARLVRDDGIDVLIDLNGHTGGNRLPVFARKPAPVQVSWLGYPNTTGLQAMDYRLTDAWADPPGQTEQWHSETLWRLPGCFVCYRPPANAPLVDSRDQDGQKPLVFGSFNNDSKISPGVVEAWSRILAATPGSRLMLKLRGNQDASIRDGLLGRFADRGIDAARLTILGRLPDDMDHLRRYAGIDIALDTFPYAGTTTTCDALWMGVPVITLAGQTHASRVGASLLHAAGLGELVTTGVDAYVDLAVRIARDPQWLRTLRSGLRERVAASQLTDAVLFTLRFEDALRQMWVRWCDLHKA